MEREGLLGSSEQIVVGLSGGPDSVALLHVLVDLSTKRDWELLAVHVHHGVRGEEADQDAYFARSIAESLGVAFGTRTIVPGPNPSEDRLRRKRYHHLGSEALAIGATAVAVGHHRDDQAETVLHRMARGTGIRGLAGIPYRRELVGSGGAFLIRPLLDCTRESILEFLSGRGISWREDSTNADPRYTRSRIRHEVIPVMEEAMGANVREALSRIALLARGTLPILEAEAARILQQGAEGGGRLRIVGWQDHSDVVIGEALRTSFLDAGGRAGSFSLEMVAGLIDAIRSGKTEYRTTWPGKIPVQIRQGRLTVGEAGDTTIRETFTIEVPGATPCPWAGLEIRTRLIAPSELDSPVQHPSGGLQRCWFDWEALTPPLEVRAWRRGDRFHPFGGPGIKEIREVLSDAKIPREDRDTVPVVADRDGVIWIIGVRQGSRAAVKEGTRKVLLLESGDA
ncbi:MAG: tRNA lysidine(34) synthetase TilS [Planctomycetota bacterium]|nr:tRNA lysidine(34) synthetase TilS [Planctomycetota bacterium]